MLPPIPTLPLEATVKVAVEFPILRVLDVIDVLIVELPTKTEEVLIKALAPTLTGNDAVTCVVFAVKAVVLPTMMLILFVPPYWILLLAVDSKTRFATCNVDI